MTVTFFSNFLNDHQLPFCQAMIDEIGADNFRFVALEKIDPERVSLGFEDMNETYPFVVRAYSGGKEKEMAYDLMLKSDVAIIGYDKGLPFSERMRQCKLTFRYNERLLKQGDWHALDPRVQVSNYRKFGKYGNIKFPLFVLCASAYTARDLKFFGFPKSKCVKWGYFPVVKEYENIDRLIEKKELSSTTSILWVGRFIDWKHPEIPVKIAKRLKDINIPFHINMIGVGDMHETINDMVRREGLSDCVSLLGAMPPSDVRSYMEKANVFLFTSDKGEGWGAVLNESLNSACVVIADDSIGSVPFMLQDGINGFTYHNGNVDELYSKLLCVVKDEKLRRRVSLEAYLSMTELWNAKVAANRFVNLIDNYKGKLTTTVENGPCSKIK